MDDPRWLRLITIGLVLAAVAVGYFLLSGRLSSNVTKSPSPAPSVLGQDVQTSPTPVSSPAPTPLSAYNSIANRTQNQTQALPRTGFPLGLAVAFSVSAVTIGWSLRKYPH